MVATPSRMPALGSKMPAFSLPDVVSGGTVAAPGPGQHKALLVMFICNHCPFVKHIQSELARIGREYGERGVAVFAINSNDVQSYPEDSPERMRDFAGQNNFGFPYLFDESQSVARAFSAACTPDFFLYDAELKLAYRGQLDDSRPGGDVPVTGRDLRAALDALLAGRSPSEQQKPSLGCSIKWKAG